jgi:hypothetical protein
MTTPDIAGLCERQLVSNRYKLPEVAFLTEAARYFETRPTGGEDAAHWSNVFNAKNCREAANTLERQAAEIERLRAALEEAAKTLEHVDGALMDMAEAGAVPAVGTWGFVTKAARKARAALTGEDTAGSPTSQNTQPGLAFSDAGKP